MKTVTSQLNTHLQGEVTSLATIWRITRTDGVEFFFTDHDQDITFESNRYLSSVGYNRTNVDSQVGLSVDNLNVTGFLDNSALTESDLRAGLFDFAEVRIGIVNWKDLSQGQLRMRRGKIGEVIYSEVTGTFETELRGMTQLYSQNAVELYQAECRADLGDSRCKVPITPDLWNANTTYAVGAEVRWPQNPVVQVTITNGDFETDAAGATTITGWTTTQGTPIIRTGTTGSVTAAKVGSNYVEGAGGGGLVTTIIEQDVDLTATFSNADLDSGQLYPFLEAWRAGTFADDTTAFNLIFKDGSGATLATWFGGAGNLGGANLGQWDDETVQVRDSNGDLTALPSGTRTITIQIEFALVTGTFPNGCADGVGLFMLDTRARNGAFDFGNVHFQCTTAGQSDEHTPPWNTALGATTTDDGFRSTVQWQTIESFTRTATVATVTDNRQFTITVTEARAVDNWFKYGAVIWQSGLNRGLVMEVKGWTQSSNSVELFLDMPFTVAVGDELLIYAGCDKRLATCISKFANVVNFRGEPYVPGQDEFLSYPDAR